MAGDVEAAAERVDHPLAWQEAKCRQCGVVTDAGVAVLDGVVLGAKIHHGQRHEQRANEFKAAPQVVDVVVAGQGDQRLDGDGGRGLFERGKHRLGVGTDTRARQVQRERQYV